MAAPYRTPTQRLEMAATDWFQSPDAEAKGGKKTPNVSVPASYFPGPDGVYLPADVWLRKTEKGCAFCNEVFTIHDAEDVDWFDEDTPVCLECSDTMTEEDLMQYAQWGLHNYVH